MRPSQVSGRPVLRQRVGGVPYGGVPYSRSIGIGLPFIAQNQLKTNSQLTGQPACVAAKGQRHEVVKARGYKRHHKHPLTSWYNWEVAT